MDSGGAPRPAPGLQAFSISMANDIPNLGLLSPPLARSSSAESAMPAPIADTPASEADLEAFKASVLAKLTLAIGKDGAAATPRDWFVATALALRDRVIHRWLAVNRLSHAEGRKRVYYLSLEFLIGRLFADVVENLRMTETVKAALGDLGVDLDKMRRAEPDAALGNGGLGRLAACLMESMASLGIPARGYGIRYDHGLFRQVIRDGWQMEFAENWLSFGNPWEFARPEFTYDIHYGGRVETATKGRRLQQVWVPDETVEAVAYDTPVVGWRGRHVNPLRLWSARAVDPLRLEVFNEGDHVGALAQQSRAEALSKILYPADYTPAGRELRLRQEYFFVSASLQDILRRQMQYYGDLPSLPDRAAIQLNDTHPSIAIAELMRQTVFADLHRIYPDRIVNKTNGITFRRWLHQANPRLTKLLSEVCGREVLDDVSVLPRLAEYADDHGTVWRLAAVKRANKRALARFVYEQMSIPIDPGALFDVHIKRIHEYKRQLLNLLDTVARYHAIRAAPHDDWVPRVKIFAGKAAASYAEAKLIIKLANDIAAAINNDPVTCDLLRLVFLPNYNVSLAEMIIPAADLSEQISTAGMEASGTGNMKLALNGALTIGTLDGANIEIREQVGDDNIFIFGLRADEVEARRRNGLDASDAVAASPELAQVPEAIGGGAFSPDDRGRFRSVADRVCDGDPYMVAADFAASRP